MDDLLRNLPPTVTGVAYADDLGILMGGNSRRDLEARGVEATSAITEWTARNKLKVSRPKSSYLLMEGSLHRDPKFKTNGALIPSARHHKYLRIWLDPLHNFNKHLK